MTGTTCKSTLFDRIVSFGLYPNHMHLSQLPGGDFGNSRNINSLKDIPEELHVVDSLRYLVFHNEFNKLESLKHTLANLLVIAF